MFLLCGLWHGASWSFVVWGAYHGVLLVGERWASARVALRPPTPLAHLYTLVSVTCGWVIFRSEDLVSATSHLASMVGMHGLQLVDARVAEALDNHALLLLPVAGLASGRIAPSLAARRARVPLLAVVAAIFFGLSTVELAASTHNPFIYFRF